MISPIGYGEHDDPRSRLLGLAGYSEETLAQLVQRSMQKKIKLLKATKTELAAYQGKFLDERRVPDHRIQLEAAKALDEVLGIKAPPARASVTVVHKLELPSWMCPDDAPHQVVEVTGQVEDP